MQSAPKAGLDNRGGCERGTVDHRTGPVVDRHRSSDCVVSELGDDPDLRAHVPGLQRDLDVLQVLRHDADDGARGGDAGSFEGCRQAALRRNHCRHPTGDGRQLRTLGKLLEDDDLLATSVKLLDDRDPDAFESADDDVSGQGVGFGRAVMVIRDAPPRPDLGTEAPSAPRLRRPCYAEVTTAC